MEFNHLADLLRGQVDKMTETGLALFYVDCNKDELWNLYLTSFPDGTNNVYRKRNEYDCSECRRFIRAFGAVVAIIGNRVVSVWDFEVEDPVYAPVVAALREFIHHKPFAGVFVSRERTFGSTITREDDGGHIREWHHFSTTIPASFVRGKASVSCGEIEGRFRDSHDVFERALKEYTAEAFAVFEELYQQNTLYRAQEVAPKVRAFKKMWDTYKALESDGERECYPWAMTPYATEDVLKLRNSSIGSFLTDISLGVDVNVALASYEQKTAPENYRRPEPKFTQAMLDRAKKDFEEAGLLPALGRRFATLSDIKTNNVIFANRDARKRMGDDEGFAALEKKAASRPKELSRSEDISISDFLEKVIPTARAVELFVEGKHKPNFVSLITAKDPDAPPLTRWPNGNTWAYTGNVADSMKARVKAAGGAIDGVLRMSFQWNTEGDNNSDYDLHCMTPAGDHIYYGNPRMHRDGGWHDVDIRRPEGQIAVENISWPTLAPMKEGKYEMFVKNFEKRGRGGFTAEIEFGGKIFAFSHPEDLRDGEVVPVADVMLSGGAFTVVPHLPMQDVAGGDMWGIPLNAFTPVTVIANSPNFWDGQTEVGNKHVFFMLAGCSNPEKPNGFFNEFIRGDLNKHRKVIEALGAQQAVEEVPDQLSGLGFSESKHTEIIARVTGETVRVLNIHF